MGASIRIQRFNQHDEAGLRKAVQARVEESEYESGHNYDNGDWGGLNDKYLVVLDKTFDDPEKASDWLSNDCEKGGPLQAVKVMSNDPVYTSSRTTRIEALTARLDALREQYKQFGDTVIKRVRAGVSEYKACGECGSRIAVKYIHSVDCPVCSRQFLYTKSDIARMNKLRAKVRELHSQINEAHKMPEVKRKRRIKKGENYYWLVCAKCCW